MLESTVSNIGLQLREGNDELDNARRKVANMGAVAALFENLSAGKTAEAFSGVADKVKWWAPGGILLHVDKERMMRRIEAAPCGHFQIKEAAVGDSCVAVRVVLTDSFQFLFLFEGKQIVGVKEQTSEGSRMPLVELLMRK